MQYRAHPPRRLVTIHARHLAVHEDEIEGLRAEQLERLRAGARIERGLVT